MAFVAVLAVIIAFARGYRIDLKKQSLTSTGIIAVSAYPKAAKVYINGQLKGVSDINLTLPPGTYEVEVNKDGYTNWKKTVILKGELVLVLDVLLYPLNPSLSPLTNLAVSRAFAVPQSDKILLFSEQEDKLKDEVDLEAIDATMGELDVFKKQFVDTVRKSVSEFNDSKKGITELMQQREKALDEAIKKIDVKIREMNEFEKKFAEEMGLLIGEAVEQQSEKTEKKKRK